VGVVAGVRQSGAQWDKVLVFGLWLAAALHTAGSVIQYVLMATLGPQMGQPFIPMALYHGFSNVRFFGQWQTMLLPFVVLPLLWWGQGLKLRLLFGGVALWWWMLLIGSGTRGSWVGLTVGAVVAAWCGGAVGWRWFRWQALAGVAGAIAFVVVMLWMPLQFPAPKVLSPMAQEFLGLGPEGAVPSSTPLTTGRNLLDRGSVSARERLWGFSVQALQSNPLLGIGPMHFSSIQNDVANHPHNAPLQWFAEWGLIGGLLWCGLAVYGVWRFGRAVWQGVGLSPLALETASWAPSTRLQHTSFTMVAVLAGLVGAMVQALVDGVVVMPISQVSLAALSAWAIGFCLQQQSTPPLRLSAWAWRPQALMFMVMTSFFAAIAVGVSPEIRRVPDLMWEAVQSQGRLGVPVFPRFWTHGAIYPFVPSPLPNPNP
jgi:hypothetical protein